MKKDISTIFSKFDWLKLEFKIRSYKRKQKRRKRKKRKLAWAEPAQRSRTRPTGPRLNFYFFSCKKRYTEAQAQLCYVMCFPSLTKQHMRASAVVDGTPMRLRGLRFEPRRLFLFVIIGRQSFPDSAQAEPNWIG